MAENLNKTNRREDELKPSAMSTEALDRVCQMLEEGKSRKEIIETLQNANLMPGMEPLNAGIIRTRKGALMVRVSDDRWPIAMYKRDWQILLSKVPAIKEALDKLNILEENPNPTEKQQGLREEVA